MILVSLINGEVTNDFVLLPDARRVYDVLLLAGLPTDGTQVHLNGASVPMHHLLAEGSVLVVQTATPHVVVVPTGTGALTVEQAQAWSGQHYSRWADRVFQDMGMNLLLWRDSVPQAAEGFCVLMVPGDAAPVVESVSATRVVARISDRANAAGHLLCVIDEAEATWSRLPEVMERRQAKMTQDFRGDLVRMLSGVADTASQTLNEAMGEINATAVRLAHLRNQQALNVARKAEQDRCTLLANTLYDQIMALPGVAEASFSRDGSLIVKTHPLTCSVINGTGTYLIGRMKIAINGNGNRRCMLEITSIDSPVPNRVHPYVDPILRMESIILSLTERMAKHEYTAAVRLVLRFLTQVDIEDLQGRDIALWPVATPAVVPVAPVVSEAAPVVAEVAPTVVEAAPAAPEPAPMPTAATVATTAPVLTWATPTVAAPVANAS